MIVHAHNTRNDPITNSFSQGHQYEAAETVFIEFAVASGSVAIDVGANVGYFTALLSDLVGDDGLVIAFEPGTSNFALLKKTAEDSSYRNVLPLQMAVSRYDGGCFLHMSDTNYGDHRIWPSEERRVERVKTICLDSLPINRPVDFIKMDVQGSEWMVIEGMEHLVARQEKLVILMEFWPFGIKHSGGNVGNMLDRLYAMGFDLFLLGHRRISKTTKVQLIDLYADGKDVVINLVGLKGFGRASHGCGAKLSGSVASA